MNSRERILRTIDYEEPDRIPFDLAGSVWTGITNTAYKNLRKHLGLKETEPEWSDVIQQIVIPSEDILNALKVDTRGVFPLTSHNWNVYSKLKDCGEYHEYLDEWSFIHHFPKNGYWFSLVKSPLDEVDFEQERVVKNFPWPDAGNKLRFAGLREKALQIRNRDKIVMTKGLCAGLFEMHQRVRGMTNAMIDPLVYPLNSDKLVGKLADLKIEFWDAALDKLGDVADIVGEGDDYGTQLSQLISPEQFRAYYKPHFARVLKFIREKAPAVKLMFHSCGNVRPIIPDMIEMGVDILNPVHITATGMEPVQLKKDFGKSIVFWGGGVDTQKVLPTGTQQEVIDDVKKNIEALAPGGGFVFSTVHNIQAEVPPENIMVMWKTLMEYNKL
ncbi:MAG: uroporphyrinogen decarboxylase family protein [Bacteroidota bacterium]|nr:uroporphyrinogen decarboxylase family protein [Bacteroidota bacterium]